MFNLFQTDRMCFEYIANIFAKSNAEKRNCFTTKQFAVLPEYFEEICEVLKAHFAAVRDGAGAEAAETEVLLQYGLAEIARI